MLKSQQSQTKITERNYIQLSVPVTMNQVMTYLASNTYIWQ